VEVARSSPSAYDSDVFRIADGRWILFSTEQDRPRTGGTPKPRQSTTLYNWTDCEDTGLQINVGEGPHVTGSTLNDATTQWNGYSWMNWEGGVVMRSGDKGKIHRVDPDFGSTLTVCNRDSQSKCWVNWKILGQPCGFQV
jgi:hypothetical protein